MKNTNTHADTHLDAHGLVFVVIFQVVVNGALFLSLAFTILSIPILLVLAIFAIGGIPILLLFLFPVFVFFVTLGIVVVIFSALAIPLKSTA